MSMLLSPRIIPGSLHNANKTACDWGWQGYIAYGCQNYVVIVDPKTVQVLQTVHTHIAPICQVKWYNENYYHDLHSPYDLKLASANIHGHVMIWEIREGKLLNDFVEQQRLPTCLEWLSGHEVSHDLLLVLYNPNLLILWNADTGVRLWKKTFSDTVVQITVDPFNSSNMTVMSTDWIMLISDLSLNQPPSEKGRKFYMSTGSPSSSTNSLAAASSMSSNSKSGVSQARTTFQKVKSWAGDLRGKAEEELEANCECLQVTYLPANRNHMLLLFPREILILDMEIGQALGSFSIENSSPSFQAVIPCRQRDILYLLHENGSVSMRAVRSPTSVPYGDEDDPEKMLTHRINLDIIYDIKCHSDVFRLSRASRLMGFCVDPVYECQTAIVLGDGRILFWSLAPPSGSPSFYKEPLPWKTLPDLEEMYLQLSPEVISLQKILPCLLHFGEDQKQLKYFKPKFILDGMFEGLALNPVCARMCPPMTTRNFSSYQPLLAVGCGNGVLQILNMSQGCLLKHMMMGCHNIKGLEWLSLTSLLVWFFGSSSSNKSEICFVDIVLGITKTLPSSRGLKESTVGSLKVSHQKNYFLVLFKNNTAELWDASNLCQLREFPSNFPTITAFEWSPSSYSAKFGKKKNRSNAPKDAASIADVQAVNSPSNELDETKDKEAAKKQAKMKEHLVFTDTDGTVYHYVVEGTSLKDGSKVPPEAGMGVVSFITWKSEMLVLGDVDGNLNFWDLKAKVSRVFPTNRGAIKRLKFAPGKGNMRALIVFNDGIEVWDSAEAKTLANIKTPKDGIAVLDADWLSSSLPVLLLSDGSARVLDATLKSSNSPINEKDFNETPFNPRLMEPPHSLKLKHILQHQRWREEYNPKLYSNDHEERPVQDHLDVIPSEYCEILKSCTLGTAERCIHVAQIFGDESDYVFWNVALHYLEKEKLKMKQKKEKEGSSEQNTPSEVKSLSLTSLDDFILESDSEDNLKSNNQQKTTDIADVPVSMCTELDTSYDILCDSELYKKLQLYRIALRDSHRSSYDHTRSCAEKLILMGQMDRAVQILLEGEPQDSSYYSDALRACLIATVRTTRDSQSTIKLVATNLIAGGKLTEGVELLCLVGKGTDACRYLQTYGAWELATWIAKVRLNHHDCSEVVIRWCEQLYAQMNRKLEALLILLSFGQFVKVLELLFKLGQTDRAILLLEACVEFGVLSLDDDVNRNLFENILLDYARLQIKLKNKPAVQYYCKKAGGRGTKLLDDYQAGTVPGMIEQPTSNQ